MRMVELIASGGRIPGFEVNMSTPLFSLQDAFHVKELDEFDRRKAEFPQATVGRTQIDGLSLSLTYVVVEGVFGWLRLVVMVALVSENVKRLRMFHSVLAGRKWQFG